MMTHHRAGTPSVSCNSVQSWKWKRPPAQPRGHETKSLCSRSGSANSLSLSRLLPPPFCLCCHCAQRRHGMSGCCCGAGLASLPRQHGAELGSRDGAPRGPTAQRACPRRPGTGTGAGHTHPPLGHEQLLGTFLLDDISQGIEKREKK